MERTEPPQSDTSEAGTQAAPAPRFPAVRGAFIAWWVLLTVALAVVVEGALYAAMLECHGYEGGLACQASAAIPLAAVALLGVAVAGLFLGLRASRRALLIAAVSFAVVVAGTAKALAPSPRADVPAGVKHLDHF